jgi:hypothetical protein
MKWKSKKKKIISSLDRQLNQNNNALKTSYTYKQVTGK